MREDVQKVISMTRQPHGRWTHVGEGFMLCKYKPLLDADLGLKSLALLDEACELEAVRKWPA